MLAAFQEVILPAVKIGFDNSDINNIKLTFTENSESSKVKKLHIHKLPQQSFAFTLDHQSKKDNRFKQLSCYVDPANSKGINRGCDLVIVAHIKNQWQILILDMKSDKPDISSAAIQLLNSELYVRYIVSMIASHYGIDTKQISYQQTIVTTGNKCMRKGATYKPNDTKLARKTFYAVQVHPKNQEAYVYLEKLLKL